MTDWKVVDLPSVFERIVRSYDERGVEIPDDGEWHRRVAETNYLLAEFLAEHSLLAYDIDISRRRDLVILHSQLTPLGQAFDKTLAIEKWLGSLDRIRAGAAISSGGLKRRWRKFIQSSQS